MSKRTSFEDALRQKMNDIPLPDENESWQKMNALLNEKERRRSFFFFRNEKVVGSALLLCALLLWLMVWLQTEKKSTVRVVRENGATDSINANANQENKRVITDNTSEKSKTKKAYPNTSLSSLPASIAAPVSSPKNDSFLSAGKNIMITKKQNDLVNKRLLITQSNKWQKSKKETQQHGHFVLQKQNDKITELNAAEPAEQSLLTNNFTQLSVATDSSLLSSSINADSNRNITAIKSNIPKTDSASNNATTKAMVRTKRRNSYFADAGVGIKQQLPIGSQAFISYNYNGNKTWLGDYIPSLYIKLEKEKQWFLQGEFHYAAPRLISGVSYRQKTKADYGHGSTTTDKYYLQKTWYTEVPVSLHIYLRPSLSAGAGVMYNILHSASVKKETLVYDALLQHSVSNEEIIPWKGFSDSFLYKTNTSLLLQTNYDIDRWSFGLRYLHDVQPFLSYTLPDGSKRDKRNTSFEVLIHYRLFRSDKFRIGNL